MKYSTIVFDFGGTLGWLAKSKFLEIPQELCGLIASLYHRNYRLAIISNSHQYSDGLWVRNQLNKYGILQYFEVVVCSSVVGIEKPNPDIFLRVLNLMGVKPQNALMVGDSEKCDGGAVEVGMDYLKVKLDEKIWIEELENKIKTESNLL